MGLMYTFDPVMRSTNCRLAVRSSWHWLDAVLVSAHLNELIA